MIELEDQEKVYEFYGVELYQVVNSPLPDRDDNKPSFSTKVYGERVLWSDFGLGLLGKSVYDFVMEMEGCDFRSAAAKIKSIVSDTDLTITSSKATSSGPRPTPKEKDIKVIPNNKWADFEVNYWKARGITTDHLLQDMTYPLKMLYIDNKFICTSTPDNPKFIYYFSEEDRSGFKVYSPLDVEHKWMSYKINLFDFENPPQDKYKDLIIFSSRKDRRVFDNVGLPYDTTSAMAEGNFRGIIKRLPELTQRYKNIYSLFDFDFNDAGDKLASKLYHESGEVIVQLTPPTRLLNFLAGIGVKDIDELKVKGGDQLLREVLNDTLNGAV